MPPMDTSIRVGVKEAAAWGSCMAGHSGSSLPSSRVSCVHREGDEFVYDKLSKLLPKHTPPTLPSTPLITFLRKLHRILSGVKEALASYSDTLPPTGGHPDGKLRHSLLLPPDTSSLSLYCVRLSWPSESHVVLQELELLLWPRGVTQRTIDSTVSKGLFSKPAPSSRRGVLQKSPAVLLACDSAVSTWPATWKTRIRNLWCCFPALLFH